jgi:hypothetical protein
MENPWNKEDSLDILWEGISDFLNNKLTTMQHALFISTFKK